MISYKLAKQLKDAGFKWGKPCDCKKCIKYGINKKKINVWIQYGDKYRPTLSELIEGCGDRFLALSRYEKTNGSIEWGACITNTEEMAKTPEEAVAKLWLKLNK